MRLDKLTHKAREAVLEAQQLAEKNGQQAVELMHLLVALIEQEGGVAPAILDKIGTPAKAIATAVGEAVNGLPKVQGGEPYMGQSLSQALRDAQKHADTLKDDYVSTEHMLLAASASSSDAGQLLRTYGVTENAI